MKNDGRDSLIDHTDRVLQQMASTPSSRLREVMEIAVRHLHAFVREASLKPNELKIGIGFLTAAGQMCSRDRQELTLLSDVLGLTTLVNRMEDARGPANATASNPLGPFYREFAPDLPLGVSIAKGSTGRQFVMHGQVIDTEGNPIPDAQLQVWQCDPRGRYDMQAQNVEMDLRGEFHCDDDGRYFFRSVVPGSFALPGDGPVSRLLDEQGRHGMRPAHVHFRVNAEGHQELITALYLRSDRFIESDTAFGVVPSLVVDLRDDDPQAPVPGIPSLHFDFVLKSSAPPR